MAYLGENETSVKGLDVEATQKNIGRLIEDSGLSDKQLAATMSLSVQAVNKWRRGKSLPDIDNLYILAKLLGKRMDDFLIPQNSDDSQLPARSDDSQLSPRSDDSQLLPRSDDFQIPPRTDDFQFSPKFNELLRYMRKGDDEIKAYQDAYRCRIMERYVRCVQKKDAQRGC